MPSGNIQRSIQSFVSTVISSTNNNSATAPADNSATRGTSRRPIGTGSWIVNDLNSAQQQIQNLVESSINIQHIGSSMQDAFPRQSVAADMEFDSQDPSYSASQTMSPRNVQMTSPSAHEITAANIIESYIENELEINANNFRNNLQFDVTDLNQSGVPLQHLQQMLRGSSGVQNTAGINPSATSNYRVNNALRNKIVFKLNCAYCKISVCDRAMRAILLADTKVELYSTDIPPKAVVAMDEDRMTAGCNCRIRDTVCSGCGNVLGYHVSQPCDRCLDARNNGHFWMFCAEGVIPSERIHFDGNGPLYWTSLPPMCDFVPASSCIVPGQSGNATYESFCR